MAVWVTQEGKCALSGVEMTWVGGQGKALPTSISIDRIRSSEPYTPGNVRLVCHAVNSFKLDMTDEEMIDLARRIIVQWETAHG